MGRRTGWLTRPWRPCWALAVLLAVGCHESHPIEGTYDVTLSFAGTMRRSPCQPPQTGYCYPDDGIAFSRDGVLILSRASRDRGEATFQAQLEYNGQLYSTDNGNLGIPLISASGTFTIPRFYSADLQWAEFEGVLSGRTISGTVSVGSSVLYLSHGTFQGTRR